MRTTRNQVILGMEKAQGNESRNEFISRRERRYFSESARRSIVEEIENGLSKSEAARRYSVTETSIYKWIARYSKHYGQQLKQVVEHESDSVRLRHVEAELEQVYALLGRAKAESMVLGRIIEQADEALGTDLFPFGY